MLTGFLGVEKSHSKHTHHRPGSSEPVSSEAAAACTGCKLEFYANSADGTIEGFARDVAVNLAEPIGTARSRQDQHGIVWVAVPDDSPTPKLPVEVVRMLGGR